jgi:dipeptidyl aminopeptidase/acylaminoacyl peptidase
MERFDPNPTLALLVRAFIVICISVIVPIARSEGIRDTSQVPALRDPAPVTIADVIQMTQFGEFSYIRGSSAKYTPARFSPNGKQFLIPITRGNITENTNDYTLLLFQTDNAIQSPIPEVLVTLSSSSNRPGIQAVNWVNDTTVAFLGENPGGLQQVYEVDCQTRRLTKLTNSATNVISYAVSPDNGRFFFLAERPTVPLFEEKARRDGVVISSQPLPDLVAGETRVLGSQVADLFIESRGEDHEAPVRIGGDFTPWSGLWLSPNGRYLIVESLVTDIPESWKDYTDHSLRERLHTDPFDRGYHPILSRYELINVASGQREPLLDAPAAGGTCTDKAVIWSPDSDSVVISEAYLPLNVADTAERRLRQSKKLIAEIKVPSLEIVRISSREVCPLMWDSRSGKLLTGLTSFTTPATVSYADLLGFQKGTVGWKEVEFPKAGLAQNERIAITLEEDMNTAPKLVVREIRTGQKSVLLDFNPQFTNLKFGQVQSITFTASDGHKVNAGLYLPPHYAKGTKYPLVIQTHGWDPQRFWIDGPWTTAFAAQPLAGRGFVVLQLDEDLSRLSTPDEAPTEASAYEGGIDFLDTLGIIDRERVGIVAFSRTGLGVSYALTHSKYHFAAANIADAGDAGYFAYLSIASWVPDAWPDYEAVNGGSPFGVGLASWLKNSGFNLASITTPVREEAHGIFGVLGAWQWFIGLSRLYKPVELIYMPDGDHVLVRPRERMASQQATVDWFSFWLQGYEDPDPAKGEQYARWRKLRRLQKVNGEAK